MSTMPTPVTRSTAATFAVLALLTLAGGASATGTGAEDVKKEVAELGAAVGNYTAERRDELLERSRATLASVDARIESLQAELNREGAQMSADAREKREAALAALRRQRTRVAEWYGALQHGSSQAWDEIRDGFAGAWDAMRESLSGTAQ